MNINYICRYMTGKSNVHSPLLYLCGLSLVHLTKEDYDIIEERTESLPQLKDIRLDFCIVVN